MKTIYQRFASLAAIGLLALGAQSLTAAEVACPDGATPSDTQRVHYLIPDAGTASCLDYGSETPTFTGGDDDAFLIDNPDYVYLGKDDGSEASPLITLSEDLSTADTTAIDWAITCPEGYFNCALGFKVGNIDPTWVVFALSEMATSGSWYTLPDQGGGLSGVALYAQVVPIPAAAWLFGSALLGLAGIGYRRKATA
jgi:hypothetical protein